MLRYRIHTVFLLAWLPVGVRCCFSEPPMVKFFASLHISETYSCSVVFLATENVVNGANPREDNHLLLIAVLLSPHQRHNITAQICKSINNDAAAAQRDRVSIAGSIYSIISQPWTSIRMP